MKFCLFALNALVLFSVPSFGSSSFRPEVGDYVIDEVREGTSRSFMKLVVASHNTDSGYYAVDRFQITAEGFETFISSEIFFEEYMPQNYYIDDIAVFCGRINGKLEAVTTSLGNFHACKEVYESETEKHETWYAARVPFARIKSIEPQRRAEAVEFGTIGSN